MTEFIPTTRNRLIIRAISIWQVKKLGSSRASQKFSKLNNIYVIL